MSQQMLRRMRGDPKLGTKVVPSGSALSRLVERRQPIEQRTVLIVIGACVPCVENYFKPWRALAAERPNRRLVVISRDTEANIQAYLTTTTARVPIVSDPLGTLTKGLNAFFTPRAYAVDGDGSLVWIQKHYAMSPDDMANDAWGDDGGRS